MSLSLPPTTTVSGDPSPLKSAAVAEGPTPPPVTQGDPGIARPCASRTCIRPLYQLEGASIKLLHEHFGVKVTDLAAGCCGIAGTFGMQKKNSELSSKISESLKQALEQSPTKNVLTECAACKMQIEHISDCTARHPIKILADAFSNAR